MNSFLKTLSQTPAPNRRGSGGGLRALAVSAALLVAAGTAGAATNWLVNPGFETGSFTPGWVGYGSHYVESTNNTYYNGGNPGGSNVLTHSGTYVGKTFGSFNGVNNWNGFYQDIPAGGESVWSADCYALTHTQDLLSGGNECWLEVTFRDAFTNVLVTYTSQILSTNGLVPNVWHHLVVTNESGGTDLTAPYGTALLRCQIVFFQPGGGYPGGSVYIDDVNLIKTSAPDPEITQPPASQTVVYGQTATFTVVATGKSALSYRWLNSGGYLSNGGRISGADTATLTIANVTTADQDFYSVEVSNQGGMLISNPGFLTVFDPGIITPPASQTKLEGQSVSFSVVAAGSTALSYVWNKNGVPLSNGGHISGATTATLTIANLVVGDSGQYTVTVTDSAGSVTSPAALLDVVPLAQASNVLLNRGFESGTDAPWIRFGGGALATTNVNYYQTADPVEVYDGLYVSQTYNSGTWNGLYQDVAATPGQIFTGEGWFLMAGQDPLTGGNEAWLEVQFQNEAGNMIGLYKSDYVTAAFPTNVWVNLRATNIIAFWSDYSVVGQTNYLVAPPGTARVRFQVTYHTISGGGSVWYDNMSLFLKLPVSLSLSLTGSSALLSFPTQIGVNYEVLYKNHLEDATWQVLQTVTGDLSGQATVTDPLGPGPRFYAVRTL